MVMVITSQRNLYGRLIMGQQALKQPGTNHPFVTRNEDVCNGSPIIEGTRTRVIDIAIEYEILGHSPDEIIDHHPHLNLSQVHDALSYYYENRTELDNSLDRDRELLRDLIKKFPSKMAQAYGQN